MYMPRFGRLTGLTVLSVILASCGGGAGSRLDDANGNSSGGGGNDGGGSGGIGSGSFLNCSALDPKKVYLIGSVGPGEDGGVAIINLENPREYCVGLYDGYELETMTITNSGRAFYLDYFTSSQDQIYEFFQEEFVETPLVGGEYEWDIPDNIQDNDILVAQIIGSNGVFLKQDGSASYEYYYQSGFITAEVYNDDSTETPYFSNPNRLVLIGVMPDSSLLMYNNSTLYLVDSSFNEFMLTSPDAEEHIFEHTSRVFTDPGTGNQSVWILSHDSEYKNARRWRIDLVTKVVSDDGSFASAPDYVDVSHEDIKKNNAKFKLDGEGNLIQIAIYNANPPGTNRDITSANYNSLVIKRPIASSQQPSVILHSDAEYEGNFQWRKEEWPVSHVGAGRLVTGQ